MFLRYQRIKRKRCAMRQTQKLLDLGIDNASVPTLTAPSIGGGTGSGTGTYHELRAIAAGDSTLKVNTFHINCKKKYTKILRSTTLKKSSISDEFCQFSCLLLKVNLEIVIK